MNYPEDVLVGPKHVQIRRYMNKIEIVTSVGFSFHILCVLLALCHKVSKQETLLVAMFVVIIV